MLTKHLDLGCGLSPRNPYDRSDIYGCDIRNIDVEIEAVGFGYRRANLVTESIPFPNDYFDSVSAFDFLEHIPRQTTLPTGEARNPFVELMNEIHRVLIPGGVLLAVTPAYPHPSAFTDPTHVNIITNESHLYFTGPKPGANMYGFKGNFELLRAHRDTPSNAYQPNTPAIKMALRRLHRQIFRDGLSHMVWELRKT